MRTYSPALFASGSAIVFIEDRCWDCWGTPAIQMLRICTFRSVMRTLCWAAEGLPYAISSFDVEGLWKPDGSITTHALELPTEGEVVRFTTEH